jgi:hypothetical protein
LREEFDELTTSVENEMRKPSTPTELRVPLHAFLKRGMPPQGGLEYALRQIEKVVLKELIRQQGGSNVTHVAKVVGSHNKRISARVNDPEISMPDGWLY